MCGLDNKSFASTEVAISVKDWINASKLLADFDVKKPFKGGRDNALLALADAERAALRVVVAITAELAELKNGLADQLKEHSFQ